MPIDSEHVVSMAPVQAVLVEFSQVLEEYAREQRELLGLVRMFHTTLARTSSFLGMRPGYADPSLLPPPPPASSVGAPRGATLSRTHTPPPEPDAPTDRQVGSEVHATKRDYDYFRELDDKLKRIGPTQAADG